MVKYWKYLQLIKNEFKIITYFIFMVILLLLLLKMYF